MKLLMALIFSMNGVFAQSPAKPRVLLRPEHIIYNPDGNLPGRFIVSYKDYEDVRIDSDLDGQVDYWRIRKGLLHVEMFFKGGSLEKYLVRKVGDLQTSEFSYTVLDGALILDQARVRESFGRTFTTKMEMCSEKLDKNFELIEKLQGLVNDETFNNVSETLIDESCRKSLNSKELMRLKGSFASAIDAQSNSLLSCIGKKSFKEKFEIKDDLFVDVVQANIKLQNLQILTNPDQYKGLLRCEDKESVPFVQASTHENGSITVYKDTKNNKAMEVGPIVMVHELVHRSGLFSEKDTQTIVDYCFEGGVTRETKKNVLSIKDDNKYTSFQTLPGNDSAIKETIKSETASKESIKKVKAAPSRSIASENSAPKTGNQLAASTSTANIPASMPVAEAAAPSSSTLSLSMSSPQPKTDVGAQQALTNSVSESRAVLSRANNLIGAMSTPAGATTLAEQSRSKIEAKAGTVEFKSRVGSEQIAGSGRGLSADRLASGDRVVEEITLDGSSSAIPAARSVASSPTSSSAPAQVAARVGIAATQQRGARSNEMGASQPSGGAGSVGGSAGGGSMASGSLGGGGGGAIPAARGIASTGEASVAPLGGSVAGGNPQANPNQNQAPAAAVNARETVINMFQSRGSYAATKNRLKDQSFTQQLQAQNITIMDLYGNSFGAAKGEVIFLDEGNRFVRQK